MFLERSKWEVVCGKSGGPVWVQKKAWGHSSFLGFFFLLSMLKWANSSEKTLLSHQGNSSVMLLTTTGLFPLLFCLIFFVNTSEPWTAGRHRDSGRLLISWWIMVHMPVQGFDLLATLDGLVSGVLLCGRHCTEFSLKKASKRTFPLASIQGILV